MYFEDRVSEHTGKTFIALSELLFAVTAVLCPVLKLRCFVQHTIFPAYLTRLCLLSPQSLTMTEEACRTRSQKRALEREITHNDVDSKKIKMEKGLLGADISAEGDMKIKTDPGAGKVQGLLKSGEVKATIKVEVQTGDEPVDMSTSKR